MLDALVMFMTAGVPFSIFNMTPDNSGKMVLMVNFAISMTRFSRFRKTALAV